MLKKTSPTLLILLLLFVVASCSWFEKDLNLSTNISFKLDRSADETPEFLLAGNKDMRDPNIEKHKDDIKAFDVNSLSFVVSNYTGEDDAVLNASLAFAPEGTNDFLTLGSISNANLKALAASGQEVNIPIADAATKEILKSRIIGGDQLTFKFDGTTGVTPVTVVIKISIKSTLTIGT